MVKVLRSSLLWLALAGTLPGAASAAEPPAAAQAPAPELIARGKYLAVAGDCAACHTAAGKAPFSGGLAIDSPLGPIFATNITPSLKAGIGGYTLAQFDQALRRGKRADGGHLYPAMPYTAYAKLTDDDVAALYAYFMHGVAVNDTAAPATALPFPFNLRFSMAIWNTLFLDTAPFKPVSGQSVEWNRGAYLVAGLAHCSTCHTPRNLLMAEQADQFLRGSSLGTWYAPDITQNKGEGIGSWDQRDIVGYLMTGHAHNGATAGGPMLEAIDKSFSKMAPRDIEAVATYLRTVPAGRQEGAPAVPVAPLSGSDIAEMAGQIRPGEQLYRDNCASCHQNSGDGKRGLPALRNHPVLHQPNADNVAMVILRGVWPEEGQGMPGFAGELSDQQIAALTNYLVSDFGAGKARIEVPRVTALRSGGDASPLLLLARLGMAAGLVLAAGVVILLLRRRRR